MLYSKILFIAVSIIVITNVNILLAADNVEPATVPGLNIYESLFDAIKMDSEKEVKQFIAFGADIDHRYNESKTPLMIASSMGSIGAVRALLKLGANPYLTSDEGMTAMDYAYKNNDKYVIAILKVKNDTITDNTQPKDIITVEPEVEIIEVPAKADTDIIEQSTKEN